MYPIRRRFHRILAPTLGATFLFGSCASDEARSALAALAASTSGSIVEILVGDYLGGHAHEHEEVELDEPISEHEH